MEESDEPDQPISAGRQEIRKRRRPSQPMVDKSQQTDVIDKKKHMGAPQSSGPKATLSIGSIPASKGNYSAKEYESLRLSSQLQQTWMKRKHGQEMTDKSLQTDTVAEEKKEVKVVGETVAPEEKPAGVGEAAPELLESVQEAEIPSTRHSPHLIDRSQQTSCTGDWTMMNIPPKAKVDKEQQTHFSDLEISSSREEVRQKSTSRASLTQETKTGTPVLSDGSRQEVTKPVVEEVSFDKKGASAEIEPLPTEKAPASVQSLPAEEAAAEAEPSLAEETPIQVQSPTEETPAAEAATATAETPAEVQPPPADEAPKEEAPAEVQPPPAEEFPTEEAPTEVQPPVAEEAPKEEATVEVQPPPPEETPKEEAPTEVQPPPAEEAPKEEAPAEVQPPSAEEALKEAPAEVQPPPADEAPTEEVPAEVQPPVAEEAPKEEAPTEVQPPPAEEAPKEEAPAEVQPPPAEETPKEEAPAEVQPPPAEEAPTEEAPTEVQPPVAEEAPKEEATVEVQPPPPEEAPKEEAPTEVQPPPAEEAPKEEAPTEVQPPPAEEAPKEEAPAEVQPPPADEAPTEEVPAEVQPPVAEEAPKEETLAEVQPPPAEKAPADEVQFPSSEGAPTEEGADFQSILAEVALAKVQSVLAKVSEEDILVDKHPSPTDIAPMEDFPVQTMPAEVPPPPSVQTPADKPLIENVSTGLQFLPLAGISEENMGSFVLTGDAKFEEVSNVKEKLFPSIEIEGAIQMKLENTS